MAIRAVTIDFWNTMVVARTGGSRRHAQRMDCLLRIAQQHAPGRTPAAVETAYQAAIDAFNTTWRKQQITPTTSDLVSHIWDALALDVAGDLHDEAVRTFEEGLLHGPPELAEGLSQAVAWAAARYPLGIISDTMFSPGRVIRQLLDRRGVLDYFDAFVFSDETGFSKPDARAFEQAAEALGVASHEIAHIGDLRRTDVAGARAMNGTAILYTGIRADPDEAPQPDAHLVHWNDLPSTLDALTRIT